MTTALLADEDLAAHLRAVGVPERESAAAALKFERYLGLLAKWNRVYNLTAVTEPAQMVTHHLLDSLSVAAPIDKLVAAQSRPRLLDVGTGAGLPGIPLAIARPAWSLTLLDSNSKKTAFVTQAIAELGLSNATVATARTEIFSAAPFDVIVSRAYSSLSDFTAQTRLLLAADGCWVAMKGTVPHAELEALGSDIECTEVLPLRVAGLDAARHLVVLKVKR